MKESHNAQRIRLIGMFEGERCAAVVIGTPAVLLDISGPVFFNSFIFLKIRTKLFQQIKSSISFH